MSGELIGFGIFGAVIAIMLFVLNPQAEAESQPNPVQLKLSASEIAGYAANAGFAGEDLSTAVAIALAESGGNLNAVGDLTRGVSKGLWQINLKAHPDLASEDLFDPQKNANAAYTVYQQAGYTFSPWSTYKTGAYAEFLSAAEGSVQNG